MKATGWIAALIMFVVILYLQMCPGKPAEVVPQNKYEALEKENTGLKKELIDVRTADSAAINEANIAAIQQNENAEMYRQEMNRGQAIINRLTAKIEGAKLEKEDSTWVKVSPHFVEGCDSLKDAAIVLNNKIDEYEEQSAEAYRLTLYEIAVRDSALNNEREFNNKFQSQLDKCMLQLQKGGEKKRNQVYAGVGMLGNQINPIAGGQVNVSLKTKGSQIYEITGMAVGENWYAGVGTKILISFRK